MQKSQVFDCFYIFDSLGNSHWAQPKVFESARERLKKIASEEQHSTK